MAAPNVMISGFVDGKRWCSALHGVPSPDPFEVRNARFDTYTIVDDTVRATSPCREPPHRIPGFTVHVGATVVCVPEPEPEPDRRRRR